MNSFKFIPLFSILGTIPLISLMCGLIYIIIEVQKWQQMVANSANWAKMMDEAKRRQNVIGDGGQKMEINDRIIRAGGKVLTEKLAQLAEDKGGQLAIGDAVMTESFQIKENYFAKSECKLGIFFSEKIEEI